MDENDINEIAEQIYDEEITKSEDVAPADTQDVEQIEEVATNEVDAKTTELETQQDDFKYPQSWGEDNINYFKGIESIEARNAARSKYKDMMDGGLRKMEEASNLRKEYETEKSAFEEDRRFLNNYRDFENNIDQESKGQILSAYGTMPQYMHRLHQMDVMASKDPIGFLQDAMKNMNITPEQLVQGIQDPQRVQRTLQDNTSNQLQGMEQKFAKLVDDRFAQIEAQNKYNGILTAKDETGNLKYANIDKIEDDVAYFMNKGLSIDDAYAKAKGINSELFETASVAQPNMEIERAKITPAPKSAKKPTTNDFSKMSLEDVLEQTALDVGLS